MTSPRSATSPRRAVRYTPAHYRGAPLLAASARHLAGRFSYGVTPALAAQVRAHGGARAWFEWQLRPDRISDPVADRLASWWPSLARGAAELWQRQRDDVEGGWVVMDDYQRWLLVRRMTTRRQVHERMTELWLNHLNVPVHSDPVFTYRVDYDRVVRKHALGRFADLLNAAITHPAMGMYLDNAVSTKQHPNENLGRELLELHTVGVGAYSEDDVKSSARILTGYLVDEWDTFTARYSPRDHWTGAVRVMDFSHANADADGRAVVRAYLDHLARHPATARRLATKLAVSFVSDHPSAALVTRLAKAYLAADTDISAVLRVLVATDEFKRSRGAKVRDPAADVVATYRALGVTVARPPAGESEHAASAVLWQTQAVGSPPHDWPRPDGKPIDNASWSSPGRLLASLQMHYDMSGTWWPSKGIAYRTPRAWLPRSSLRFDQLVDHLSQQLLARRSTAALLKACCQAVGLAPHEVITRSHALVKWDFPRLLTTFLDSPAHLTY